MYGSCSWKGLTSLKATFQIFFLPSVLSQSQCVKNFLRQGCLSPQLLACLEEFLVCFSSIPSSAVSLLAIVLQVQGGVIHLLHKHSATRLYPSPGSVSRHMVVLPVSSPSPAHSRSLCHSHRLDTEPSFPQKGPGLA